MRKPSQRVLPFENWTMAEVKEKDPRLNRLKFYITIDSRVWEFFTFSLFVKYSELTRRLTLHNKNHTKTLFTPNRWIMSLLNKIHFAKLFQMTQKFHSSWIFIFAHKKYELCNFYWFFELSIQLRYSFRAYRIATNMKYRNMWGFQRATTCLDRDFLSPL